MDDLISRQAAIDTLETVGYDFSNSELSETELVEVCEAVGEVRQDMINRIKKMPSAQPEYRWIPCDKELPSKEMPVWLTIYTGDVIKAVWRNMFVDTWGYAIYLRSDEMLAWMPRQTMPEPYREEGEQE